MWAVFLGRTELCKGVWNPRPENPQIISNENNHLALFESVMLLAGLRVGTRLS